jgi:hypothetical protein
VVLLRIRSGNDTKNGDGSRFPLYLVDSMTKGRHPPRNGSLIHCIPTQHRSMISLSGARLCHDQVTILAPI